VQPNVNHTHDTQAKDLELARITKEWLLLVRNAESVHLFENTFESKGPRLFKNKGFICMTLHRATFWCPSLGAVPCTCLKTKFFERSLTSETKSD